MLPINKKYLCNNVIILKNQRENDLSLQFINFSKVIIIIM